jgi:hypothetical protein
MSHEKVIALNDVEATLAAQGKLGAIVRVIPDKYQPTNNGYRWEIHAPMGKPFRSFGDPCSVFISNIAEEVGKGLAELAPFPAPGQRLGLKESWAKMNIGVAYKATFNGDRAHAGSWRSPVTMPAWAIRHRPTVQEVRAVQVCRMQPEDAIALGFSTKLREHDAVCALREQVAEHYRITPETWVWFATVDWR